MASKKAATEIASVKASKPPADFALALEGNAEARAAWDKLSYTHRREHVEHVEEAKKPETRRRRVEKSVALLAAGKKEPR